MGIAPPILLERSGIELRVRSAADTPVDAVLSKTDV